MTAHSFIIIPYDNPYSNRMAVVLRLVFDHPVKPTLLTSADFSRVDSCIRWRSFPCPPSGRSRCCERTSAHLAIRWTAPSVASSCNTGLTRSNQDAAIHRWVVAVNTRWLVTELWVGNGTAVDDWSSTGCGTLQTVPVSDSQCPNAVKD